MAQTDHILEFRLKTAVILPPSLVGAIPHSMLTALQSSITGVSRDECSINFLLELLSSHWKFNFLIVAQVISGSIYDYATTSTKKANQFFNSHIGHKFNCDMFH